MTKLYCYTSFPRLPGHMLAEGQPQQCWLLPDPHLRLSSTQVVSQSMLDMFPSASRPH